jgi:hypothetical protein
MSEREHPDREEGADSQTVGSGDEAHREPAGDTSTPEPGHPYPGEGVGMPDRGAGQAKMDSTQPIGTEDQGEPTDPAVEGEKD